MNEDAFLAALRDDPADEVTWLALADWLEEDGQGQRADLLRLTRQMRSMPAGRRGAVQKRVVALLQAGVRPVVVERQNSLGMRFALVPPGRFFMGSRPSERGRNEGEHRHEVELTKPFWMGVFPLTQAQWKAVMGKNPSYFCSEGEGASRVAGMDTSDFPVDTVSWRQVQTFVRKLKARGEEKENGWDYRLPSEAEWEYACRGGGFPEPFCLRTPCKRISSTQANFDGTDDEGPDLVRTTRVGSYEPNPLGLYDMHGNVWEWCHDWYDENYYLTSPKTDPPGPSEGTRRAQHGGSWDSEADFCRAAHRARIFPDDADAGFRLAFFPPALTPPRAGTARKRASPGAR